MTLNTLLLFLCLFVISLGDQFAHVHGVREQAEAAIQREKQTAALYNLSRDLTSATDLNHVANIIISQHRAGLWTRCCHLPTRKRAHYRLFASSPDYRPDENELAVAAWAFEHDQPAGRGTDTLPAAALRCHPLKTSNGIGRCAGSSSKRSSSFLTPEQRQTLAAFANQSALAIERASLSEQARQAELLRATKSLQTALLNSISHDLRTPLVSITGALSALG